MKNNQSSADGNNKFKRLCRKIWIYIKPWLNWKFLLTYGLVWSWHLILYAGIIWGNAAVKRTCLAIYGVLWLPWCQENIFQVPLAIFLYNRWFKEKNEALENMKKEAKKDAASLKVLWKKKPWLIILVSLGLIGIIVGITLLLF